MSLLFSLLLNWIVNDSVQAVEDAGQWSAVVDEMPMLLYHNNIFSN